MAANAEDVRRKKRYREKVDILGNVDPYTLDIHHFVALGAIDKKELPIFSYFDIVNYLVLSPSAVFDGKSMLAYKSMDAHKYLVAGHVRNVLSVKTQSGHFVVKGQVHHSQSLNKAPLEAWVAVQMDGVVVCAHCSCMAGLGECCSHVGALLYALEAAVGDAKRKTCTSVPCGWKRASDKPVEYLPGSEINFTTPGQKRKCESVEQPLQRSRTSLNVPNPSESEREHYFQQLSASGCKSGVLSLVPNHCSDFTPKSVLVQEHLPITLPDLFYRPEYEELSYEQLLVKCEELFGNLTYDETKAQLLEQETRTQFQSSLWFLHRSGRITASRFKAFARTDENCPAPSLIRLTCNVEKSRFSTEATRWGCEHEEYARKCYQSIAMKQHTNLCVSNSGFFINSMYPFMGASPDAIVTCTCCGKGVLEIKCPFCVKDKTLLQAAEDKSFCLTSTDGKIKGIDSSHAYYYQCQHQLFTCNVSYCDFVVWTGKSIVIQRLLPDEGFFEENLRKVLYVFKTGVMPELVGRWYSRNPLTSQVVNAEPISAAVHCYCRNVESSEMAICSQNSCVIKKFHISCLRLKTIPSRKWLCPDCRKQKRVAVKESPNGFNDQDLDDVVRMLEQK